MSDAESGDEYMEPDSADEPTDWEEQSSNDDQSDDGDEGFGGGAEEEDAGDDFRVDVVEPEKIAEAMGAAIGRLRDVVQLPSTSCRLLLHHFHWSYDAVVEHYFSDPDKTLQDAHVPPLPSLAASTSAGVGADCPICMDRAERMEGVGCEHVFCQPCWRSYVKQKVMEEGSAIRILCPATACLLPAGDDMVLRLLDEEAVKHRYRKLLASSFVESSSNMRWCPAPSCGRALKANHVEAKAATCSCGMVFCFACGHPDYHAPVTCHLLKVWTKKCSDDSETSNWINANTKECPKCAVTIEKDGGCNHMTCRSPSCKYEWCWVCQGPWEPHGSSWYNCNRFNDSNSKAARDDQERSRQALKRYLHYCNRYTNHLQSMKLENKLYTRVKGKMEELQAAGLSWIEVQFLKAAVDVLCWSRRTLCYTYVFAYYVQPSNQSAIFEDNQRDLEMATEQLSEFLERDLEKENTVTLKQHVQDKYRYCEHRRNVLLNHCKEGDDQNTWHFTA